jgi:hypothetical protein
MSAMTEVIPDEVMLQALVGSNIGEICDRGYTAEDGSANHCAHFVSHLIGLSIATTCAFHHNVGVTIRVNEMYNACARKGRWANRPNDLRDAALIFFTQDSNMFHDGTMGTSHHKHVGFWVKPHVFDYSTVNRQVMRESLSGILARLDAAYDSNTNGQVRAFYGSGLPAVANNGMAVASQWQPRGSPVV